MSRSTQQAFAIVRVDRFQPEHVDARNRTAVTRVVWSQDKAEAEVRRLTRINPGKECEYFWRVTRVDEPSPAF